MSGFFDRTVLVVENNAHMRCMVCAVLAAFGTHRVLEAEDALSGYLLMASEPVDLVLLDFFLGERDGADFIRLVRADVACPNQSAPIVIVTALPRHPRVAAALEAGAGAILGKPVAPRLLYETAAALMGERDTDALAAGHAPHPGMAMAATGPRSGLS